MVRVALVGWNGRMNAGDDAMSAAFVKAVRETAPDAEIRAYADHDALPYELRSQGVTGIRGFNRLANMRGLRRILLPHAVAPFFVRQSRPNLLLFGGGSIFRERRNIAHLLKIVRLSKAQKPDARVVGVSVSLGPFEEPEARKLCATFLSHCDAVIVRDSRSMRVAAELSPDLQMAHHFDAALAYCHSATPKISKGASEKITVGVALRAKAHEAQQAEMVGWLARLDPRRFHLKFVSMSSNPLYDDARFAGSFLGALSHLDPVVIPYSGTLRELFCELASCDIVVAVRLHALIFASALGKPVLFHPYHQKLIDYAEDAEMEPISRLPGDFHERDPSVFLASALSKRFGSLSDAIESSASNARFVADEVARAEARQ